MATLYLECFSGISGDMTVASLLDLGVDQNKLFQAIKSLKIDGYEIKVSKTEKNGVTACDFDVVLESDQHDHGHTHEEGHHHLPGEEHTHARLSVHDHGHFHEEEHSNIEQQEHVHHHEHRNLQDIEKIIDRSEITARAKELSKKMFSIVAKAEAKVHGKPVEEVHFHEVGAVDSIIDIVSAAVCIDLLNIDQVYCSPLSEGNGFVRCQHGLLPVPVPATAEILREYSIPISASSVQGEMVTPTGAAIVAALTESFERPQGYIIKAVGYGAGKRNYPTANVVRAFLLEKAVLGNKNQVILMECNIDDMTGEQLGFAMETLLAAGALDVWFEPIYMKKNRPANKLCVLCRPVDQQNLEKMILLHTTTIGVRSAVYNRTVMERKTAQVTTPYGVVTVKYAGLEEIQKITVEYESAKAAANRFGVPLEEVYRAARQNACE